MKRLHIATSGAAVCLLLLLTVSCIKPEYDLRREKLDLTVSLGGDSLYMPLGATARLSLDSLLGPEALGDFLVTDENGVFVLEPDAVTTETKMHGISEVNFNITNVLSEVWFTADMDPGISGSKVRDVRCAVDEKMGLDFNFEDIPDEIVNVTELHFKPNTHMKLDMRVSHQASAINLSDFSPEITVTFPPLFLFNDPNVVNNTVTVTDWDGTGGSYVNRYVLDGIDLDGIRFINQELHFTDTVRVGGAFVWHKPDGGYAVAVDGFGDYAMGITITCTVDDIEIDHIKGNFDIAIDPQDLSVSLDDAVPDMLKDDNTTLDFAYPYLLLTIEGNSNINYQTTLQITPVYDGVADESRRVETGFKVYGHEGMTTERYWLGNNRDMVPPGQDYIFQELDLTPLFYELPDKFEVTVTARTETTHLAYYYFGADIDIKADVGPRIPLAFGEDLHLEYRDTLDNMPDMLNDMLTGSRLELLAEVENTLPLDILADVVMLDENNAVIPVSKSGKQRIQSCTGSGDGRFSTLTFNLSAMDGELEGRKIAAVLLGFDLESNTAVAGQPVNKNQWLQAKLKARIPGGLTIDGSTMLNE